MILTFTGDISVTGSFTKKVNESIEIFDKTILSTLCRSNFVVGNLEGPTTNSVRNYNINTPLKSPTNTINYLRKRNITVFNLANNHSLDFGKIGLKDTLSQIKNEDCTSFGAGLNSQKLITPLILKKENISVALFGITKCSPTKIEEAVLFSADEFSLLKKQIKLYKKDVDFIIINFHGGEEFSQYPSPIKRTFLKKIAKIKEVNFIVAHHSHTFQGVEHYRNTPICYSLGNFIFDIPNHKHYAQTDNSALLTIHFTKTDFTFNFIPYEIKSSIINATNLEVFTTKLKELSDFTNYRNKWQKEAFRILFRKENPLLKKAQNDETALQNKNLFAILFSKKFYQKTSLALKDKYQFSIYYNAILYKIKNKFIS